MNRFGTFILTAICAATLAFGANVDGKWSGEMAAGGKKKQDEKVTTTLNLKAEGDKLTGTFEVGKRRRGRPLDIVNGKVDGDSVSFETKLQTKKKGEVVTRWEGAVKGDSLELVSTGKKGKQGPKVILKRQG